MLEETRKALEEMLARYRTGERGESVISRIENLKLCAEAERLLEEAARTELPAKHARVHAMGHAEYVGPVLPVGRGYRVESHVVLYEASRGASARLDVRWVDVFAVHSVEYLSQAEWDEELKRMQDEVAGKPRHAPNDPGEDDVPSDATAEAPAADQGERLATPDVVLDLLLIAGEVDDDAAVADALLAWIASWSNDERYAVADWAAAVHVRAADNDHVVVPPRPQCLDRGRPEVPHG